MRGEGAVDASAAESHGLAREALRDYLVELELALKRTRGVVPEDVLADALEHLGGEMERWSETSLSPSDLRRRLDESFGEPAAVAAAGATNPGVARGDIERAPGWRICCTRCGRSSPAGELGFTRIAARSWQKYVVGRCSACTRLRWLRVIRDLDDGNLTERLLAGQSPEEIRRRMHPARVLFGSGVVILAGALLAWLIANAFGR